MTYGISKKASSAQSEIKALFLPVDNRGLGACVHQVA
jgi:hypothetical protein